MAAVKKLPSGNYQVRWLTPDGLSRKKTFRLKADADRHAAAMVSSKADGVYIDSAAGKVTFQAYAWSNGERSRSTALGRRPRSRPTSGATSTP